MLFISRRPALMFLRSRSRNNADYLLYYEANMGTKQQRTGFIARWIVNALGIWIAAWLLGSVQLDGGFMAIILAGLVLSLVNAFIKPLVVFLSLPALLITLGLFMFIINGFMVFVASQLVGALQIDGFTNAILAGMVIGLVNYILTNLNEKGS